MELEMVKQRVARFIAGRWEEYDNYLRALIEPAQGEPPFVIYTIFLIILLIPVLNLLIRSLISRSKHCTFIICGLNGAGKTNLLSALENGISNMETGPSMKLNETAFYVPSEAGKEEEDMKYVNIIDVPERLALQKLPELLPNAAGVVVVVDAMNFIVQLPQSSKFLYEVLTDTSVVEKNVPVMVCCNKADKSPYETVFMFRMLEKAIDKMVQASRIGALHPLTEPFSFSRCSSKVSIGQASAFTGQLADVKAFIKGIARTP